MPSLNSIPTLPSSNAAFSPSITLAPHPPRPPPPSSLPQLLVAHTRAHTGTVRLRPYPSSVAPIHAASPPAPPRRCPRRGVAATRAVAGRRAQRIPQRVAAPESCRAAAAPPQPRLRRRPRPRRLARLLPTRMRLSDSDRPLTNRPRPLPWGWGQNAPRAPARARRFHRPARPKGLPPALSVAASLTPSRAGPCRDSGPKPSRASALSRVGGCLEAAGSRPRGPETALR